MITLQEFFKKCSKRTRNILTDEELEFFYRSMVRFVFLRRCGHFVFGKMRKVSEEQWPILKKIYDNNLASFGRDLRESIEGEIELRKNMKSPNAWIELKKILYGGRDQIYMDILEYSVEKDQNIQKRAERFVKKIKDACDKNKKIAKNVGIGLAGAAALIAGGAAIYQATKKKK